MSPYEALGVDKDATPDEIKKAHRRRARKTHPDKGGSTSEFQVVQKAYEVLADPDRRKRYDETGSVDEPSDANGAMLSEIAALIFQLIDSTDVDHTNLIDQAMSRIRTCAAQAKCAMEDTQRKIDKRKSVLKRLKVTEGEANPFHVMVETSIQQLAGAIDRISTDINRFDRMLELLGSYDYTVDERPMTTWGHATATTNPWGGLR